MNVNLNGWMVVVLLLGGLTAYAIAEEITLTTYYPSPRGVYKELRVGSGSAPSPAGRLQVVQEDPSLSAAPAFRVDDETPPDPTPVIDKDGNVGIGTASPPQLLTLGAPEGTRLEVARVSASLPWSTGGALNPGAFVINQQSAGSSTPGADLAIMRDQKKRIGFGDTNTYLSSQDGGDLLFYTNWEETGGAERMRIQGSTGNVGIGTTSPSSLLDLNGALTVRGMAAPAVSPAGQGRIYFDSTANQFQVSENGSAYRALGGSPTISGPFVKGLGEPPLSLGIHDICMLTMVNIEDSTTPFGASVERDATTGNWTLTTWFSSNVSASAYCFDW